MEEFSAVLICKNEEQTLARCLTSLQGVSDIVVLDTGSTDRTVEIARHFGCTVIEAGDRFCYAPTMEDVDRFTDLFGFAPTFDTEKKYFHFADARNYAMTFAKNDWCFQPDADEVVEWDLAKVNQAIQNEDQLVYRFVYSWKADGTPGLEFTHCKFFRRSKICWGKWVHEVPIAIANGVKQPRYVYFIYHKHYQEKKESRGAYLPSLELSVTRDPLDVRNLFYLGREYFFNREWKKSIEFFERSIPTISWAPERGQAHIYVGECKKALGLRDAAKAEMLESLKHCDTRREPWFALGELLQESAPDEALKYYKAATAIPFSHGKHGYFNDTTLYEWVIPERIAAIYGRLGEFSHSKYWWQQAIEHGAGGAVLAALPAFYGELPKISILVPTLGRPEGLQRLKDSIEALNYPKELLEVLIEEDEPRIGVPQRLVSLLRQATGDFACYMANDTEFTPDALLHALKTHFETGARLVSFNTGDFSDKGNICEHFIIRSDLVHELGEVFDTRFNHVGVDTLLWSKCKQKHDAFRSEKAIVKHHHFSRPGCEDMFDEVNEWAWNKEAVAKDRAMLAAESI